MRNVHIQWMTAFLDTPRDKGDATPFWLRVTGAAASDRRGARSEFLTLVPPDGDAFIRAQDVDGGDPRAHLDLHVDDVTAATARAVELGATITREAGFVTLTSPGGFAFCLVAHHGERARPAPRVWPPGGHHSLVDQLCLDIPSSSFPRETVFWAALTAWDKRPGELPEFEYLARPTGMPLRLLLQRLDHSPAGQPVRAHIDLACDDVETEAARHIALGATFVRRRSWITLRDPTGREYCVTTRGPFTRNSG